MPAPESSGSAPAAPEQLAEYHRKRDFARTPEPSGAVPPPRGAQPVFVVQRHRASRLHYDTRLEIDGVLVSWSVPKGPTLDPGIKRLAVRTEDHPLDYATFEGVIPAEEYGGGDVIVWDLGTWQLHGEGTAAQALQAGELHFDLFGQKLRGRFALIRRGRGGDADRARQWLLVHKHDEAAVDGWDPEAFPLSVLSGRTNDEVAAAGPTVPATPAARTTAEAPRPGLVDHDDEIAELDAMGAKGVWTFAGRELSLTNLDKVLFPATGDVPARTKRDLVRYYAQVSDVMQPYLANRPLNMNRFPSGIGQKGFWNKARPSHTPEWIGSWLNESAEDDKTREYLVVNEPAVLPWLANLGALELHAWTSAIPDVQSPTYALIDVDPGTSTTWDETLTLTRLYRTALDHLGVVGFPKVTGQRGTQIWVPIAVGPSYDDTTDWVEQLSRAVGSIVPDLISWEWKVSDRRGRARLDFTQNRISKTLVAPYSVRPAPGAPVSMPISWDELDDPELRPDRWHVDTAIERLAALGDLFAGALTTPQRLPDLT